MREGEGSAYITSASRPQSRAPGPGPGSWSPARSLGPGSRDLGPKGPGLGTVHGIHAGIRKTSLLIPKGGVQIEDQSFAGCNNIDIIINTEGRCADGR